MRKPRRSVSVPSNAGVHSSCNSAAASKAVPSAGAVPPSAGECAAARGARGRGGGGGPGHLGQVATRDSHVGLGNVAAGYGYRRAQGIRSVARWPMGTWYQGIRWEAELYILVRRGWEGGMNSYG